MTDLPVGLRADDVRLVPLAELTPYPDNPRRHDIDGLRTSLRRWGPQRVILVQRSTGYVVAGNGQLEAMLAEGYREGLVAHTDLSDTEAMAYVIADNAWAERGYNDEDALGRFLRELAQRGAVDEALGLESADLDRYLRDLSAPATADEAPALSPNPWVKPGMLLALGRHRVLCADATEEASYERLLGDGHVSMIWTDPPYGVEIEGGTPDHLTILGDEADAGSLRALLMGALTPAVARLAPGRGIYVAGPGGSMARVFLDVLQELRVYRQTIIWVKDSLVLGRSDYHYRHEQVFAGASPKKGKFTVKAGEPIHYGWRAGAAHWFVADRTQDTVWEIPRPKRSIEHPTMKPVELVERSILASSRRGETVLDPFAGSGTTIIAAERTGRTAHAIELDPRYAQVCAERWQTLTGDQAQVIEDGPGQATALIAAPSTTAAA